MNAVVGGLACVWLGMVLAISFLEAPLKFRAPGVTLALGLGIGRVVFGALNRVELVLLAAMGVAVAMGPRSAGVLAFGAVVTVVLGVQLALVRPRLARRSRRVLAGEHPPRARSYHAYVALEVAKRWASSRWPGPHCGRPSRAQGGLTIGLHDHPAAMVVRRGR